MKANPGPQDGLNPAQLAPELRWFAVAMGLFLGLAIIKFGNPVILDQKIVVPASLGEAWTEFWPTHWAVWLGLPLALAGGGLIRHYKLPWRAGFWLFFLPLFWLVWQVIATTTTVDSALTASTLPQLAGCLTAYYLGAWLLARPELTRWLLPGLLAAFTFCLLRGVNQHLYEFPASYQNLTEGEKCQWTNFPPELLFELKNENLIVNSNGLDVANPAILTKFAKGRVYGTLVYPNALAGLVLLLFPAALWLAFNDTKSLKPLIRWAVMSLTAGLGGAAFCFTGSKLAWLLAVVMLALLLLRLNWSPRLKWMAVVLVVAAGLGVFTIRFHKYLSTGASSASARLDYWRAAVQTAEAHPLLGTGPGTFQKPYAQLKSPTAEMARLTHNDYLEQFSDSGLPGGLAYLLWISLALTTVTRRFWRRPDGLPVMLGLGVLAWFLQGLGEFSLYIPALAWTAFTLLGALVGLAANELDKKAPF